MNFIAHIHLSGNNEKLLVGNYIADLIRPKELDLLPEDIKEGIYLHRYIDSFTDAHQVNKNMLDSLYGKHRKYATVLLDIFYDYFLIRHWNEFSSKEFLEVCHWTYNTLEENLEYIPLSVRLNIENLLNKRWLEHAYGSIKGLERTFYFLKMRMSRPDQLNGASSTLIDLDAELEEAFLKFYPDLIKAVVDWGDADE